MRLNATLLKTIAEADPAIVLSRLNFAPGSPSRTPGYFRRWSAAICRLRLRDTDARDLPNLTLALEAELATRRPRKTVCRALRQRIDQLSIPTPSR